MSYDYKIIEINAISKKTNESVNISIPSDAKFNDIMSILKSAFNHSEITYFNYIDDDDDSILVRCDDDLASVFLYYNDLVTVSKQEGTDMRPLKVIVDSGVSKSNNNLIPDLTISLDRSNTYPNELGSNNSSSKSTTGGIFISNRDDLILSDQSSVSSMSEEITFDSQWSGNSVLAEDQIYLIGEIGSGATGRVMRALYTVTQEMIAVKIIDLELDKEESIKQLILSELCVLRQSKSPHIIEFIGAYFVENSIHICTELMDGFSLDQYGLINESILSKCNTMIVNGLDYLWSNNILHRDIKPSNLLINSNGQVKLCDFGISKHLVRSIARTFTGTVEFMCPERIKGDGYNLAADIWSLGITLFILSVGHHPLITTSGAANQISSTALVASSSNILMSKIVDWNSDISLFKDVDPQLSNQLSDQFKDFIGQCLRRQVEDRFNQKTIKLHNFYTQNCNENNRCTLSRWIYERSLQ